jgi:plastocyanin
MRRGSAGLGSIFAAGALALGTGACVGRDAPDRASESPEVAKAPAEGVSGRAPAAMGGIPSVIVMRPIGDGATTAASGPAAQREEPHIDQFGLSFSPTLLVVDVGTPLTFTNSEGALTHNVHLRSVDRNESVFNEDTNSGDAIRATLTESGGYDVLCDMHPGMAAFVFVTDAPYTVFAEAEGSFTLGRVPPGAYEIRTWTRAAGYGPADTVSVAGTFTEVDLSGLR